MVGRHPVVSFFVLTFLISWIGALCIAAPYLARHQAVPQFSGVLMFPAMLLGPCLAGLFLTRMLQGAGGVRELFAQIRARGFSARWYATLLLPPVLVVVVLFGLSEFVSPAYRPNWFPIGILFGIPAGFLEEVGWTGYALPRMRSAVLLGMLWSLWHLPVMNYLGAATPHGSYWLVFFFAFAVAMTAMRVLICWIYRKTGSILMTQLMHVSSTGSLVVFGASRVNAAQEALWYAVYGLSLWIVAGIVIQQQRARVDLA